jgi:Zn-dependent peptidase ImmA (M78 family)
LPFIDVDEGGGPREIARKMRTAWMIPPGPIDDLTLLAERAGIVVVWCEFGAAIDGITMIVPGMPPCIFLDRTTPADRMRASLAHEIGHVIMHRVPTDSMEEEAYTFGAELLVPEKELRREFIGGSVTLEKLARLKSKWRVSMQFLLYQAGQLACLKPHQTQYLWKRISMLGWKTREPAETEFAPDAPKLFPRILKLHSEELGYEMSDFAALLKIYPNDIRHLYGMQEGTVTTSHLRLIN